MANHLKAGKLNRRHSLRYRPFDTYLLDSATWERQRDALLQQTNLLELHAAGPWLDALRASWPPRLQALLSGWRPAPIPA